MEISPKDINNIIEKYKSEIEHVEKTKELKKEFDDKKYYCRCCLDKKHETICKITEICERCREPIGKCCDKCHRNDETICNICFDELIIIQLINEILQIKEEEIKEEDEFRIITFVNNINFFNIEEIIEYLYNINENIEDFRTINVYNREKEIWESKTLDLNILLDMITYYQDSFLSDDDESDDDE